MGEPSDRTRDPLCAVDITHDLLDCNCGYVTRCMKVMILDVREGHAAQTRHMVENQPTKGGDAVEYAGR